MSNYKLSVLIPARNEEFLAKTVQDLLENKTENTEIIIGLDGSWAEPGIPSHKDITIFYVSENIGQRKMQNQLCRLASGKYVMKLDAHCKVDRHFDRKMLEAFKETGDNVVMIPLMKNLWVFDWVCEKCGDRRYQGQTPKDCPKCDNKTNFKKDIIWIAKKSPNSTAYRFDTKMHFQYHGEWKKKQKEDLAESMSLQGSCFMMTKEKYWGLGVCDEKHGSWGQQAVEVACSMWLSGGRVVINKRTFYGHLFRTAGGDFSFPYPQSGKGVQKAREYSQDLWLNNKHPKQIYPLSWLIEKFKPLPDWHDKSGFEMLEKVNKAGEEFYKKRHIPEPSPEIKSEPLPETATGSKGIIYYTCNTAPLKISKTVQSQLRKISKEKNIPIVSCSLKPMPHFGVKNIVLSEKRGVLTMFKQILTALENSTADIIFHAEHDVIYHPSHFDFIPPRKDKFYYNVNFWKVRLTDGFAVSFEANQVSGLCAYREHLLKYYRERIKEVENSKFDRSFEPGRRDASLYEQWKSIQPNVDIRHGGNLSGNKWSKNDFRDKSTCVNWREGTIDILWNKDILKNLLEKVVKI